MTAESNNQNSSGIIVVYGTSWCGGTRSTRNYLDRNRIPYQYIDIETDSEGLLLVKRLNHGNRSVPTIIFPDDSYLVEPSESTLAKKCQSYTFK
jgi:glutaredoxin